MKLSDLIIEHGPYESGQEMPAVLMSAALDLAHLNELREELIAARAAAKLGERFEVEAVLVYSTRHLLLRLTCKRCAPWDAEYNEPVDLAELNQRAGEHAEVCR